jgi:hypothetical protein
VVSGCTSASSSAARDDMKAMDVANKLLRSQGPQDRGSWCIMHYTTLLNHQHGAGTFSLDPGRCSSRPANLHIDLHLPLQIKQEESKQCTQISVIMSLGKLLLILKSRWGSSGPSREAASTINSHVVLHLANIIWGTCIKGDTFCDTTSPT